MKYSRLTVLAICALAIVGLLIVNTVALVALLGIASDDESPSSFSYDANEFVLPDSNARIYSEKEISQLNDRDLSIAINEIYARHGLIFNDSDLSAYFEACSWYRPSLTYDDFESEVQFNKVEQQNVVTLAAERDNRNL